MQKVVIIGKNSYLADGLEPYLTHSKVAWLGFNEWQEKLSLLAEADWIVNFAMSPSCYQKDMPSNELLDYQIAEYIKSFKAKYIFISSRKVYGQSAQCVRHRETDPLLGTDWYSKNKIKTEQLLQAKLPGRLTVLRIANVLGEPVQRKGYKTFVGWICENFLEQGKLIVTQNVAAVKDFVTKDFIYENLSEVIRKNLVGTFNLSSGIGIQVHAVLAGYVGEDNLIYRGQQLPLADQFILDNTLLSKSTGKVLSLQEIHQKLSCYREQLMKINKHNQISE